jgi:Tol biopolymer transport system component/DNA-binding winged helix-turn-helix (wHTH) protein
MICSSLCRVPLWCLVPFLPSSPKVVSFAVFTADLRSGELYKNGVKVRLERQPFEVLSILLEHPRELVSRDELRNRVWPQDTFVDFDHALNTAITKIRVAVGDAAENPRFVETVPRRGYRFIGPVNETVGVMTATDGTEPGVKPAPSTRRVAVTVFLIAFLVGSYYLFRVGRANRESTAISMTPVTASGKASIATVSPDGKYVAYVLEDGGQYSVWLHHVASGRDVQIVPASKDRDGGLQFSQDGNYLYYLQASAEEINGRLYQVPILGGISRLLVKDVHSRVAISPDGRQFAFVRQAVHTTPEESYLVVANVDGSNERRIAKRVSPLNFGRGVAWRQDGKLLAVTGNNSESSGYATTILFLSPNASASEATISSLGKWQYVGDLAWLPDGSGLIADGVDQEQHPLWLMKYPSGEVRRITDDPSVYNSPSLTADGRTLAAIRDVRSSYLWISANGGAERPQLLTSHTLGSIAWTPESQIVYSAGALVMGWDLWMQSPNNGQARRLTEGGRAINPEVSPDGRAIVFQLGVRDGTGTVRQNLWRVDSQGKDLKQLTWGDYDVDPKISPDGKWVIYSSFGARRHQYTLCKVPLEGGEPFELTQRSASIPIVSPNGRHIAFLTSDPQTNKVSLAIIAFEGGEPTESINLPPDFSGGHGEGTPGLQWAVEGSAIYCVRTVSGVSNIWKLSLHGGVLKQITDFDTDEIFAFAWSHDGNRLAVVRGGFVDDVVFLTGFR